MSKNKRELQGMSIRTFDVCMIVVAIILYIALLFQTMSVADRYTKLNGYTDEYILCEKDAVMVEQASDYLTEQVRLYAQNMDIKYMNLYFKEANETKRRETALEDLMNHNPDKDILKSLQQALDASNDLMNREFYSMKLISVANGYDESLLPKEVRDVQLKAEDLSISQQGKIELARKMVFDGGYQDSKALIKSHLSHFLDGILNKVHDRQLDSAEAMEHALFVQRLYISILFIMNVITFVVITILIVRPMSIYIKSIKNDELLQIMGAYEFKYLALTYNNIYEMKAANEVMLKKRAEKDPLTGLMNRNALEDMKIILRESCTPLAFLLMDVDCFKDVNDNYGHEMGDKVLQKIGKLLQDTFRNGDYIIRMGGDEFAVILVNFTEEHKRVASDKIKYINDILSHPKDDCPAVSLSCGIAFSEEGFYDKLYNEADQTLYEVKEAGRNGCRFYGEKVNQ